MTGILFTVAKRLLSMVAILAGLAGVMFVLQQVSGTDPVHAMLGPNASPAAIAAERAKLGLNLPLWQQYFHYVWNAVHGNLGMSYRTRRPVTADLAQYLPATVELTFYSLVMALTGGTLLGVASAARWRGAGILRWVMMVGSSAPVFLLAIGGLLVFYRYLGVLPSTGRISGAQSAGPTGLLTVDALLGGKPGLAMDALAHLVMPASCVAVGPAVSIGRVLRSSLRGTLGQDYVRTARAKGLPERKVVSRHAIRNAAGPVLAMAGLQTGIMFAGVVVVEDIFAWPGVGYYTAQSIPVGDFPAIAGVTLVLGAAYVLINTAVDLLQVWADPRQSL